MVASVDNGLTFVGRARRPVESQCPALLEAGYPGNRANHLGTSNAWDSASHPVPEPAAGARYAFGQITSAQGGRQITIQGKLNW